MSVFGDLMGKAKSAGAITLRFDCVLERADEDFKKWWCRAITQADWEGMVGTGRTGEEALRNCVQRLEEMKDG